MKCLRIPALLACGLIATGASAQSAVETQPRTDRVTTPGADATGDEAARQSSAGAAEQPGRAGRADQAGGLDQHIAACLLLGNQEEVAIAQFAKEHIQNEACKKFAEMLIEHHQQALSKIEQAAPQLASLNLKLRNAGDDSQPAPNADQASGLEPGLLLARQVKEECLAGVKKALGEKQGAEFDKCFVGQQVMAHMSMLATLKGSEPFASQQLKPVIHEGIKMTEKHLAEAKDLAKQLEQSQREPRQARAQ